MRLYFTLLWAALSGQLANRGSFLLELMGRAWLTAIELLALLALVSQAQDLAGFGRYEIVYLYGVASLALGIAEMLTDGAGEMPRLIRTGEFDGLLVRPAPVLVQVMALRCRPQNLGRTLQGLVATAWALHGLGWSPGPAQVGWLLVNVGASFAIYVGIFVAEAAMCIFTVQSTELFNAFSYGGLEMSRFPLPIYSRWLRNLFLWIIPVGFASYYPALRVLGREDVLGLPAFFPWLAPVVSMAFFGVCLQYWAFAVNKYRGTGS
jgi:ABC-2 type transport system permease protein